MSLENNENHEFISTADLPYAFGKPQAQAVLKQYPEDFLVDEELGFELSDEGEHIWLLVEKRLLNTADILQHFSRIFRLKERDIGYSGLKDKQAVTTQWISFPAKAFYTWAEESFDGFSLPLFNQACMALPFVLLEGSDSDLESGSDLDSDSGIEKGSWIKLRQCRLHSKKLKRGSHKTNRFTLTLRDFEGDKAEVETRLAKIQQQGVPNYFGSQRFGNEQRNLDRARDFFNGQTHTKKRRTIGLWLSAARSYLFNAVVAKRVEQASWNTLSVGDVAGLAGSKSVFVVENVDDVILKRLNEGDIHPTAPMFGAGDSLAAGDVDALENDVLGKYSIFTTGLIEQGLKMERRKMRLFVDNLSAKWCDNALEISFSIEVGAYATVVIRELLNSVENNRGLSQ